MRIGRECDLTSFLPFCFFGVSSLGIFSIVGGRLFTETGESLTRGITLNGEARARRWLGRSLGSEACLGERGTGTWSRSGYNCLGLFGGGGGLEVGCRELRVGLDPGTPCFHVLFFFTNFPLPGIPGGGESSRLSSETFSIGYVGI